MTNDTLLSSLTPQSQTQSHTSKQEQLLIKLNNYINLQDEIQRTFQNGFIDLKRATKYNDKYMNLSYGLNLNVPVHNHVLKMDAIRIVQGDELVLNLQQQQQDPEKVCYESSNLRNRKQHVKTNVVDKGGADDSNTTVKIIKDPIKLISNGYISNSLKQSQSNFINSLTLLIDLKNQRSEIIELLNDLNI
ncbi:hypothetical protein CANARDRAFT_18559 [[Candida] arabinofermentans NRRL YB-2248]|uniref:Uncharacterized protein n=1 Tax=[Candida] arabinofermentans NRRL YB-2248 TaxID=983967 RepID=A0A1E4SXS7_9ASCO|nr:hypothetical protein CANARDRAFT_18559 [[Candida] arabinofermentans NRRL YB-2248]